MAARRKTYRFLTATPASEVVFGEDLDESDIWGLAPEDSRISIPQPSGLARKKTIDGERGGGAAIGSVPLNIPKWSKGGKQRQFFEDDGRNDDDGKGRVEVIPPHELLWRSRAASFSVQEGIGRTLKGRDLSRVRDLIWLRTGFED